MLKPISGKFKPESKHDFVRKNQKIKNNKRGFSMSQDNYEKTKLLRMYPLPSWGFRENGENLVQVTERYTFCTFRTQSELSSKGRPTFVQNLKNAKHKMLMIPR